MGSIPVGVTKRKASTFVGAFLFAYLYNAWKLSENEILNAPPKSYAKDIIKATDSQHPQIKTIVATGHDGTVYSLSIENGKRVDRSVERE